MITHRVLFWIMKVCSRYLPKPWLNCFLILRWLNDQNLNLTLFHVSHEISNSTDPAVEIKVWPQLTHRAATVPLSSKCSPKLVQWLKRVFSYHKPGFLQQPLLLWLIRQSDTGAFWVGCSNYWSLSLLKLCYAEMSFLKMSNGFY